MTKIEALVTHLDCDPSDIAEGYDDSHFEHDGAEYWVLTDDEANTAWDESLDSYLDECVLPELPAIAQQYFDAAAWKRDARYDGRGHSLSPYDGAEHEVRCEDGTYLFIYRCT